MTIARASTQLSLLQVQPCHRITSNAQARNAYGSAAQEIVCAALDLDPVPINGACSVCFDAQDKDGAMLHEIKSVKNGGKVVCYDWRMTKEAGAGVLACYSILCHRVRGCRDGAELYRVFAAGGLELMILKLGTVHEIAREQPRNKIKATTPRPGVRMGYDRGGYKEGYRNVPTKALKDQTMKAELRSFELYGISFQVQLFREL